MNIVQGKPKTSGKRRRPAPTVDYPPGHFTRGIGTGRWLPGWTPTNWRANGIRPSHELSADASRAVEAGTAFGGRITLDLPKTPHGNRRPGALKKAQA